MLIGKRVLAVVAHPDDEVLGLGGTIHRLSSIKGTNVAVCMMSKGVTSRFGETNKGEASSQLSVNLRNMSASFDRLGVDDSWTFDFPDNQFDSIPLLHLIKAVESTIKDFRPHTILTHHNGDLNIDHRLTAQAVITAVRPTSPSRVQVCSFETPSSTEWQFPDPSKIFVPNLFVELTEENLAAKVAAITCYENEIREFPHPRSPRALEAIAQRWGSVAGMNYAEAFSVIRIFEAI